MTMTKKLKGIELVFENMDYIVIPIQFLHDFSLRDVQTDIWFDRNKGTIRRYTANAIMLNLKEKTNRVATTFKHDVYKMDHCGETIFKRIYDYEDITSVNLIYEDASEECFAVRWIDGKDEYHNKCQSAQIDDKGNLIVRIENKEE